MMSTVLAIILVITSLMGTTMIAQAANYSAFPVWQDEKENNLQTAPELKLNQSYRVSFKNAFIPIQSERNCTMCMSRTRY